MKVKTTKSNYKHSTSAVLATINKGVRLSEGLLNGIVGDHLNSTSNSLARDICWCKNGMPLDLTNENIKVHYPYSSSRICIMVHGLINDETIWDFADQANVNYGSLLQDDLDYTPFYVRYNTGLHISNNGKLLSQIIQGLLKIYPVKVENIVIIGHSMGGLVIRSACYYAPLQAADWVHLVDKIFFLGTPHLGAPLEKFGNAVTYVLKKIPISYTKLTGDIINLRSAGIKDLRYGYLTDADWQHHHPDALLKNNKTLVPLLEHVSYFLITGTLTDGTDDLINQWFGDALVRKNSATGKAKNKHHLAFDLAHHKEFTGLVHHKLVNTLQVYDQIKEWMQQKTVNNFFVSGKKTQVIDKDKAVYFPNKPIIKKSKINGVAALTTDVLREGLSKLDELNKNRITYKILNRIPLVNIFSKEIESIHVSIGEKLLVKVKSLIDKS